jgi:hypothetical protein
MIATFDRAAEVRPDFRNGYQQVLARKIPKKAINQDFRVSRPHTRALHIVNCGFYLVERECVQKVSHCHSAIEAN